MAEDDDPEEPHTTQPVPAHTLQVQKDLRSSVPQYLQGLEESTEDELASDSVNLGLDAQAALLSSPANGLLLGKGCGTSQLMGEDGGGGEKEVQCQLDEPAETSEIKDAVPECNETTGSTNPRPQTYSLAGIDLNSAILADQPDFRFIRPHNHLRPIQIFRTPNPLKLCWVIKHWLMTMHSSLDQATTASSPLRMESLDLHLLSPSRSRKACLVVLEGAARLKAGPQLPITIFAVFVKCVRQVRWFYTTLPSPDLLLKVLILQNCLEIDCAARRMPGRRLLLPKTKKHRAMFTFLAVTFMRAAMPAHHPDFLAAEQLMDYCPNIYDLGTALDRLKAHDKYIRASTSTSTSTSRAPPAIPPPEQDRYAPYFYSSEVYLIQALGLKCSEYMLLKRKFFRGFWKELMLHPQREIGVGEKVRTEEVHIRELKDQEQGRTRVWAKRCVIGWRVLGFLSEVVLGRLVRGEAG